MLKHTLNFSLTFSSIGDKTSLTHKRITQTMFTKYEHTHTHFLLPQKTMLKNCSLSFDNEGFTAQTKHQIISFLPDLQLNKFQMNLLSPSTLMTEVTGRSKNWHISTRQYGVTFQKLPSSVTFTVTTARIANLTGFIWFQREARKHINKLLDYFISF